jgi:glyoxylase-like metal-dependent hydrolase (beta-lactamase superfamily II)
MGEAGTPAPGVVTEVAPDVRRIIAPNPGLMTGPGTNTYLVGDAELAVVDPGPDDDVHLERLCRLVGRRLRWILVTHTHVDHSPLSARLSAETGAEVLGFGPAPSLSTPGLDAHDAAFRPDRRLADGDRVDVDGLGVDALHTPGHAANHLCFVLAGTGLLFSGDHVMDGSTVVIAPPDGDMTEYLRSLERVQGLAPRRIAPGHGAMIEDPAAVLDHYLTHRHHREGQVLAQLARAGPGGVSAEEMVPVIYAGVPERLHPVARYSLWAHLRKLGREGRATSPDAEEITAPWTVPRPG